MKTKKPVNLQLTTIKFSLPAIVSILHRASGVILFLFIPLLLWMFDRSISYPQTYLQLQNGLGHPVCKLIIFGLLAGFIYHFVAGIRHMLMDMGIGETREGGRLGSKIVLISSVILIILLGVALW